MTHKTRTPMDVIAVIQECHRYANSEAADEKDPGHKYLRDVTRAGLLIADLIEAGKALDVRYVEEEEGMPAHWVMNVGAARRFQRALTAVQG